jgi:hypothetical protein
MLSVHSNIRLGTVPSRRVNKARTHTHTSNPRHANEVTSLKTPMASSVTSQVWVFLARLGGES